MADELAEVAFSGCPCPRCEVTARGALVLEARRSARRVDALIREDHVPEAIDEADQLKYLLDRLAGVKA